ncbi:alpha/beta hydrolase [Actinoallomurus vinaceus]|uniref:Alpha/beta hydrolase n=1 Tax=Actinoallomurus vinaceus TaxID=1080074 RepID=A0ABP8U295_9ACTN
MRSTSRIRRSLASAAVAAAAVALTAVGIGHATADTAGHGDARSPVRCSAPGHRAITVVLVHGAWADSSGWSGEINQLQRAGCVVRAADNPVENLTTDAEKVAAFVRAIPGPVLLVGHSYGGAVITNAAAQADNVVGLVFVDAYAPAVGEAINTLNGATSVVYTHPKSELLQEVPGPGGSTNLLLTQKAYADYFGNDLTNSQAREGWASQTEASSLALGTPTKYAAWQHLPSWSFISSGDQIITPDSLAMMAKRAHSKVTWFKGGSHLTLVTHPGAVTAVIGQALSSLLKGGS